MSSIQRFCFMVCCLSLVGFAGGETLAFSPTRPPNVILVFCDNLGYGDIEPFGSTVHKTPELNRMAREGRRFTHFYVSAGVCTPSRASLMTGCYAQRVGMHTNPRDGRVLRPLSPYGLHPDEVTLAEVLKQAGYVTGIIGKWHLGDALPFLPTRQGFDFFFGIPYSDDMTAAVGQRVGKRFGDQPWPPLPLMHNETVIEAPTDRNLLTKKYTEQAIEFISQNQETPFFLYMPQAMPGSTRAPFASPEFQGRSQNGPWGDAIEELDWSLGQILQHLRDTKLDRRTLVIWTSDNGAPLAKRNRDDSSTADLSRGSNGRLHGRGYTTSEGAFRVPALMWWPGTVEADTTCDRLATTMDLLPTLAHFAGADVPGDRVIDGGNIAHLISPAHDDQGQSLSSDSERTLLYYEVDQLQAVRQERWKLFVPLSEFTHHPHFRSPDSQQGGRFDPSQPLLFDVVNDVGCTENLATQHSDIVKQLMKIVETARKELGDRGRPGRGVRPRGQVDQFDLGSTTD